MRWKAKTQSCIFIKLKILEKLIAGAFNNDNEALLQGPMNSAFAWHGGVFISSSLAFEREIERRNSETRK